VREPPAARRRCGAALATLAAYCSRSKIGGLLKCFLRQSHEGVVHMRLVILALALLAFPVTAATAGVPNMTCRAKGPGVTGMQDGPRLLQSSDDASHVFRIANGKVSIRHSSRDEYFYNDIKEVELGRYVSGHMVFVLDYNNRHGYVVIAGPGSWDVMYLDCR
jgi:hypothetical protein